MHFIPQTSISNISPDEWPNNANPLVSYDLLALFESSGVITAENGWQPLHLCLYDDEDANSDKLIAVIPSYVKSHSYGEYVFDWAWADFYNQQGLDYYPKLISATPLTPCLAPKLLGDLTEIEQQNWYQALYKWQEDNGLSSWHINFDNGSLNPKLNVQLFERHDIQFHWANRNYQNFDDFLSRLKPKKRRNIQQERRKVQEAGWSFEKVYAKDVSQEQWSLFYNLYSHTFAKKSGWAQLNFKFFQGLSQALPDNCLLVLASKEGECKAASLFFVSDSHLYGRYWGAFEDFKGLHFETCYYQGIELAIELGLAIFEPGAQGEHKLARGFEPVITKSFHHIANDKTREPIQASVEQEKMHIQQRQAYYGLRSPYKDKYRA